MGVDLIIVVIVPAIILGWLIWCARKGNSDTIKLTDEQAKRAQQNIDALLEREAKDINLDGEE